VQLAGSTLPSAHHAPHRHAQWAIANPFAGIMLLYVGRLANLEGIAVIAEGHHDIVEVLGGCFAHNQGVVFGFDDNPAHFGGEAVMRTATTRQHLLIGTDPKEGDYHAFATHWQQQRGLARAGIKVVGVTSIATSQAHGADGLVPIVEGQDDELLTFDNQGVG
jgi:hypothetical protein